MRTPRRSRPSARPSTTSSPTSNAERPAGAAALARLIDELPRKRLDQVLTHTSWAAERAASYERLEFLGDSVLELAIARELYERFPDASEGRLAKIRAHVVSRQSCSGVARQLGLGERLVARARDVPEPELQRLARSRNVLAAVLEAAIAAVYLEHGFAAVEPAVVGAFEERIDYARSSHVDNKTELQEALARTGRQVQYLVLAIEGPAHDRRFVCSAVIDGEQLGTGRGSTKKAAEQEAARQALEKLGIVPDAV